MKLFRPSSTGAGWSIATQMAAFVAIFFFIFAPRINVAGGVNAGAAVVLLVFFVFLRGRLRFSVPAQLLQLGGVLSLLGLYSWLLAELYGNNPIFFANICVGVFLSVTFGWMLTVVLFRNQPGLVDKAPQDLVVLAVYAISLNALVITLEFLFPSFKEMVEAALYQDLGANINYAEHGFRLRGLASAGGAGMSIVNALGVLLLVFLVAQCAFSPFRALLCGLVIVTSNIFTGRTGLIFGLLFFIALIAVAMRVIFSGGASGWVKGAALFGLLGGFAAFAWNFELDAEVAGWAFEWVDGLATGKISSASSDDLESMLFLPTDLVHLFFGIGFFEGTGALYPRSDSGYVKTVLTLGLIFGALLYSVIALLFLQVVNAARKYAWLVFPVLAYMFIVEIKEPFLYQNYAARIVLLLAGSAIYVNGVKRHADSSRNRRT